LVDGNASIVTDTDKLPDDHFDLALSQRGPDFNHWLVSKLKDGAFVIQELVAPFSCYPLREIFGRTNYAPYNYKGRDVLLHKYAEWGLFPVSVKEYFYEEFYRDVHHFEADLRKSTANLTDWHVGTPRPYEAARDRVALELYARYNTTPRGIRMLQHRMIFVLRRTTVAYYPVDGLSSNKECRQNE
jgi:hypothetical protein